MNLPRRRATPRRTAHPVAPLPAHQQRRRSPEANVRRAEHADDQRTTRLDFTDRVRAATPRGLGDCGYWEDGTWHAGTPGCQQFGPHRGNVAHHRHFKGMGGAGAGTNATTNGAWLCNPGHDWVHATNSRTEAERLGLIRTWSDPWPAPPTSLEP